MKRSIISVILALAIGFGLPAMAVAQTPTTTSTEDVVQVLLEQIQALLAQITVLQEQVAVMQQQQGVIRDEIAQVRQEFKSYLSIGTENTEVTELQRLLALDTSLYPEGIVSGYYGPLTQKAVQKFQKKYGIEQAGVVGPKTRAKLNELFGSSNKNKVKTVVTKKDYDDDDKDYDDDKKDDDYSDDKKYYVCHKGETLSVATASLKGHLGHGDYKGKCSDDDDSNDDSDKDETNPIISSIEESNLSDTSVTISWKTDEDATSKVMYHKTSDDNWLYEQDTAKKMVHSITLTNLSPDTEYEYKVLGTDADGNTGYVTGNTFTTSVTPDTTDTTGPVISDITETNITDTAAKVSWNTDESATSKITYNKLGDATLLSSESPTLVTSHAIELTSLDAETTYEYTLTSVDALGNTTTSSTGTFTTLAVPDTTSPVISALTATNTATGTVSVTFTTDEIANGVVWYGTSSPLTLASPTMSVSSSAFELLHDIELTSLSTSTMYYYQVESEDESTNKATSEEKSFTTN